MDFKNPTIQMNFTTHHIMTKPNEKSIRQELERLNLPIDIINTADNIFQQMQTGTRRGQKRKQLIFHCVRTAYDHHGIPRDQRISCYLWYYTFRNN